MATIGEMLTELAGVKQDIKTSLAAKGLTVGNDFTTYAEAVDDIPSGEVKENKILVILTTTTTNTQEQYDSGCEVEGSTLSDDIITYIYDTYMIYKYTTVYSPGESGQPTTVIKYTYNNIEYNSLQAVLDAIYGVGNAVGTDLTGIDLVNYVNTLANTYNLTIYGYNGDLTTTNWTYGCEDPDCGDYYDEGYGAGYADYPDSGTTPNPEYADDCNGTWQLGYDAGFIAHQEEAEGSGDEPEPEPEPEEPTE